MPATASVSVSVRVCVCVCVSIACMCLSPSSFFVIRTCSVLILEEEGVSSCQVNAWIIIDAWPVYAAHLRDGEFFFVHTGFVRRQVFCGVRQGA